MKRLIGLLVLLSCFLACTKQEAHLVYLPEETEQPTPVPTATPMPEEILLAPVDGVALEKAAEAFSQVDSTAFAATITALRNAATVLNR